MLDASRHVGHLSCLKPNLRPKRDDQAQRHWQILCCLRPVKTIFDMARLLATQSLQQMVSASRLLRLCPEHRDLGIESSGTLAAHPRYCYQCWTPAELPSLNHKLWGKSQGHARGDEVLPPGCNSKAA